MTKKELDKRIKSGAIYVQKKIKNTLNYLKKNDVENKDELIENLSICEKMLKKALLKKNETHILLFCSGFLNGRISGSLISDEIEKELDKKFGYVEE